MVTNSSTIQDRDIIIIVNIDIIVEVDLQQENTCGNENETGNDENPENSRVMMPSIRVKYQSPSEISSVVKAGTALRYHSMPVAASRKFRYMQPMHEMLAYVLHCCRYSEHAYVFFIYSLLALLSMPCNHKGLVGQTDALNLVQRLYFTSFLLSAAA